jgi:hypothetical protein
MRRFVLPLVLPTLAILLLAVLPLLLGRQTLYLRDVMNAHLPAKAAQAAAWGAGELPTIDLLRGGQPLLGNPNTLAVYPTSLLLAVGDPLWALNAHFWLHWLLAPFTFFWLGRAFGLTRPAAWAGGALYATGGYFLSLLNLFNLMPAATLTPALVAAALDAGGMTPPRPWRWPLFGAVWALILLGGDPFSALLALLLAVSALWLGPARPRPLPRWPPLVALALGAACATPVGVEFLRILPFSFRSTIADQTQAALTQSVPPAAALEWLWPLCFGRYDFGFWGGRVYDQGSSLLLSLFPGVLAWALLAAAGRPRGDRTARWAWAWLGIGLFCALGRHNPLMAAFYELPGATALRFPIKFWLLVAIAMALLGAVGFERFLAGGARRRLMAALGAFAALYLGVWLTLLLRPDVLRALVSAIDPRALPGALFAEERLRLLASGLLLFGCALALVLAASFQRRAPTLAAALLLALHVGSQLSLLESLYETDDADFYRQPPAVAQKVPADAMFLHGSLDASLFGRTPVDVRSRFPDRRQLWLNRCRHLELGHPTAAQLGRRYDLIVSPEGLDTYYSVLVHNRMERAADDAERLRALTALGVDFLVLDRPLSPGAEHLARRLHAIENGCTPDSALYALEAAPAFRMVGRLRRAESARASFDRLAAEGFDARTTVVVPEDGLRADVDAPAGQVLSVAESRNAIVAEVESPAGGVFATRRAWLPLYRATIDGAEVRTTVVDAYRLGLEVPAGRHRLELAIDTRPTHAAFAVAAFAVLSLLAWTWHGFRQA